MDQHSHLRPVIQAISDLDPYSDTHLSPILREGRLRELRRHTLMAMMTSLESAEPSDGATARGLSYVSAVGAYISASSAAYPIDPYFVAMNGHLHPIVRRDFGPEGAVDSPVLTDPAGRIYADPISVALTAAYPARLEGIVLRAESGPGRYLTPPEADAALGSDRLQWGRDEFPIIALRTEEGAVMVRHPDNTWTTIAPGLVPPPRQTEETEGSDSAEPPQQAPLQGPLQVITPAAPPQAPAGEQTSALKGARGESRVFAALSRRTALQVQDVSHRARSADMVVKAPGCLVFVDAKDYTTAVPEKEVQKFRRDLGARGADAGVLVSLSSSIVGVKGTLVATLEALPEEGRIVPIVYAASGHEDVIAAAVDLATHLARAHPGTIEATGLHPRDALEAYVAGLEEVSDLFEDARAKLGGLATSTSAGFGAILEELGAALRDQRRLVRAQRSAIESPEDREVPAGEVWELFAARYTLPDGAASVTQAVLAAMAEPRLGDIRAEARWRFLKTKATHVSSGATFAFLKSRTDFCRPLAQLSPERVGGLLARHPKKVRVADGVLSLELGDSTAADAVELAAA